MHAFNNFPFTKLLIILDVYLAGISNEYCQLETFHPHCLKNEVIVIDRAVYGRHRVGKCLSAVESSFSQDIQFFGCFSNVTAQLDVKCSGKSTCEVRIPDADLEKTRTCLPGLQMFLEVSYRCLEGKEIVSKRYFNSKLFVDCCNNFFLVYKPAVNLFCNFHNVSSRPLENYEFFI